MMMMMMMMMRTTRKEIKLLGKVFWAVLCSSSAERVGERERESKGRSE